MFSALFQFQTCYQFEITLTLAVPVLSIPRFPLIQLKTSCPLFSTSFQHDLFVDRALHKWIKTNDSVVNRCLLFQLYPIIGKNIHLYINSRDNRELIPFSLLSIHLLLSSGKPVHQYIATTCILNFSWIIQNFIKYLHSLLFLHFIASVRFSFNIRISFVNKIRYQYKIYLSYSSLCFRSVYSIPIKTHILPETVQFYNSSLPHYSIN